MTTVDPTPPADQFGDRLEFETLISDLSARFINLAPGDVDLGIEDALRQVCEFLAIDLAVLWQWSPEIPGLILPTHSYVGFDAPPITEPLRQEQYPWTLGEIVAGRSVAISTLQEVPEPEGALDRESARLAGIKSNLTLPLTVAGESPVGLLAFNTVLAERDWPDVLVHRLELVAQVFTNALARARRQTLLEVREARLSAGADLARLAFYEVDLVDEAMYVDERLRDLCGFPEDQAEGLAPLRFWAEHIHPDDRRQIMDQREAMHSGVLTTVSVEYRYAHPLRGEIWIQHIGGVARRGADGRAAATYGVLRDVTPRRSAEEALRKSYAEVEELKDRLQAESEYLKAEIRVAHPHAEIVGRSALMQEVLYLVEQVAGTDSSVLLQGETGTGKELLAREIHGLSKRHDHLMVTVNCAALPSGLIESELFGREKGAYTGALTRQAGRFELADGSTIFLDEIGELSLDVQAKLLRVLETGEIQRLGSPRTITVDVRLLAATNRDLTEEIRQGRFREDLFYRLNVFPIRVPPLRERPEDIPLLVWSLLEELCTRMGKKVTQVPRATMDALQSRAWPGNVRELRNVIERAVIFSTGDTLRMPEFQDGTSAVPRTLAEIEREHILLSLERTGWKIKGPDGAAAELGLNPSTLYSRMKKLDIQLRRRSMTDPAE